MLDLEMLSRMNFAQLIEYRLKSPDTRNKIFIMAFDRDTSDFAPITYQTFFAQALVYGHLIERVRQKKGVAPGKSFNVGVMMNNYPEFLYVQAGCSLTNSTLVAINTLRAGEGLAHDVNYTDVGLLFTDEDLVSRVNEASKKFAGLSEEYIVVRGERDESRLVSTVDTFRPLSSSPEDFIPQPLDDTLVGMIIFTSGTTGAPKGIEISWRKLMDVGFTSINFLGYGPEDTGYICMPLGHSNSMYLNYMPALIAGATIGLRARFSSSKFVSDIYTSHATIWNCVGRPVTYILAKVGDADYSDSSLRIVVSTGTTADEQEKFKHIFGLDRFVEAYGQTETGAITVKTEDSARESTGKRNPGRPFLILDENIDAEGFRNVLGTDRVGEIAVDNKSLGDSAFKGYYRNPEATRSKLYRHKDGKIYYLTGDLGKLDEMDNLYFMGRTGEWYRKKGENRAESSAEEYLIKFGGIITLAAFGMPDSRSQEDYLIAVVEVQDAQKFNIQRFIAYCSSGDRGLAPDFIRVVTDVPKTSTAKIVKRSLKAQHIKRTGRPEERSSDIIYAVKKDGFEFFTVYDYKKLIDSYLPQCRERLEIFLSRVGGIV